MSFRTIAALLAIALTAGLARAKDAPDRERLRFLRACGSTRSPRRVSHYS